MTGDSRVRELPAYRAVLAVDVKNFSGLKAVDHRELSEKVPQILERAFERAGYAAVWEERRFPASEGDGYVVGFRPEVLPILIGPVVDALQDELAYLRSGPIRPRMRLSIAVGPLADSGDGLPGDGSGAAMVEVHRLLDCEPVRELLDESDPEVTFLAVVISRRVYDDVVASGYATKAAGEFLEVPVRVKSFEGIAYLHVPKPSGRLLTRGLGAEREDEDVADPQLDGVTNTVIGQVSGQVVQSRDINVGSGPFIVGGGRA